MLPHPAIYFTNCILTIITNFPSEHFTPDELPEIVLGPQQIGYPTAGRSAPNRKSKICSAEAAPSGQPAVTSPHPRSRKGIVHLFFAEKKAYKIRKTRTRVFPQHLSKSQRLLRRLTSLSLVDFSREGAILRRRSPNRQSLFEAARKSSICTHQPKQSTRTHEKCDSR
ncbi:hypothetical protein SDC9_28544 [bioreactor metagenome]|uniref:Uncharacterized protein n=1 Tax=bioreactor metagenome TaxID=1076179 RepID=A0A644UU53_9ZZZZ